MWLPVLKLMYCNANGKCVNLIVTEFLHYIHTYIILPLIVFFSILLVYPDRTAAHKDVCFLQVDEGLICSEPRNGMVVTYSECCCHYGRGWGPECNTCPPRNSGDPSGLWSLTADHRFIFHLS